MDIPSSPYFHGSSEDHVESILKDGIDMSRVQSRDDGFFGDGFYVANTKDIAMQHATTVGPKNPAILSIDIASSANILYAGEMFSDGTIIPSRPPSWHDSFLEWSLGTVEDAAVWEYATDRSKEDIMTSAEASRTPGSEDFDRQQWYKEVTEYAKVMGYDVVYWTEGEIILKNPRVVTNRERVELPN